GAWAALDQAFSKGAGDPGGPGCDFDRDGVSDAFRAPGVTWWYFSSLLGHWVYLNQSADIKGITLDDVNGDGRCDVTTSTGTYLTPRAASFDITLPADQAATVGQATSLQLAQVGGGLLIWGATGLPPGLSIDRSTGLIQGTPSQAGSYTVQFGARDARDAT